MTDPYSVLGVGRTARPDTIKKAYRKRATKHHPDRNPGDEGAARQFRAVQDAYELLSDPARRKKYDETGDTTAPRTHPDGLDFLEVLVPPLLQSLQEAMQSNRVAVTDLVAKTKGKLNTTITAVEHRHKQMEEAKKAFTTALARLSVDEGENLLASVLKSQLGALEEDIRAAKAELDKLTRATNYLKRCRYQTDKGGDSGLLNDLLAAQYKVLTWGTV